MKNQIHDIFLSNATKENLQAKLDVLLHIGCDEGNFDIVKYVLTSEEIEKHANISLEGNKALINACTKGHLDIVKYLLTSTELKKHANINAQNGKALDYACFKGHLEVVKYLTTSKELKKKIDINKNIGKYFKSALEGNQEELLWYFMVDLNVEKTPQIERALKLHPNKKVEKLFELRDINKSLNSELLPNEVGNKNNKRIKM